MRYAKIAGNKEKWRDDMSNELIPQEKEFQIIQTMAKNAVQSKFFDKLGNEAGILSIMLYARELGLPPMQCVMGGMWNIQGKIEISARMMNLMIRKAGHKIEIIKANNEQCILKGVRNDTGETHTESLSVKEAKDLGMYKKGVWETFTSDMLFARVISRLARRLFADVIGTAYVEGELTDLKPSKYDSSASKEVIEVQEAEVDTNSLSTGSKLVDEPKGPLMGISEDIKLNDLIGDDLEYKQRIFAFYKVKNFTEIEMKHFDVILAKVNVHNEERLKKEMETS